MSEKISVIGGCGRWVWNAGVEGGCGNWKWRREKRGERREERRKRREERRKEKEEKREGRGEKREERREREERGETNDTIFNYKVVRRNATRLRVRVDCLSIYLCSSRGGLWTL